MKHLTFANVVSTLALFAALSGASYAAVAFPANSVGTRQLKRNAVTAGKLAAGAVAARNIAPGAITGSDINTATLGKVPSAQVADQATAVARVVTVTAAGTAPVGASAAATATCPAGLTVTGGGASLSSEDNEFVNDSYPAGTTGWTADVFGGPSAGGTFTVFAICTAAVSTS